MVNRARYFCVIVSLGTITAGACWLLSFVIFEMCLANSVSIDEKIAAHSLHQTLLSIGMICVALSLVFATIFAGKKLLYTILIIVIAFLVSYGLSPAFARGPTLYYELVAKDQYIGFRTRTVSFAFFATVSIAGVAIVQTCVRKDGAGF